MAVEPAQVDCVDHSASRAEYPQEPIARPDGSADCGRKDHGRVQCLALIPGGDQALGILKRLRIGRATGCGFLLRDLAALILHLAAVEANKPHGTSKRNSAKAAAFSNRPAGNNESAGRASGAGPTLRPKAQARRHAEF